MTGRHGQEPRMSFDVPGRIRRSSASAGPVADGAPAPGRRARTDALSAPVAQAKLAPAATATTAALDAPTGGGEALPAPLQERMERSMGADFSAVRVHQDDRAASVGAEAYARGTDIHVAPGRYAPGDSEGQRLIAHELAHVVQQGEGRVSAPQGKGGALHQDPALEAEADAVAARVIDGAPVAAPRATTSTPSAGPIQAKLTPRTAATASTQAPDAPTTASTSTGGELGGDLFTDDRNPTLELRRVRDNVYSVTASGLAFELIYHPDTDQYTYGTSYYYDPYYGTYFDRVDGYYYQVGTDRSQAYHYDGAYYQPYTVALPPTGEEPASQAGTGDPEAPSNPRKRGREDDDHKESAGPPDLATYQAYADGATWDDLAGFTPKSRGIALQLIQSATPRDAALMMLLWARGVATMDPKVRGRSAITWELLAGDADKVARAMVALGSKEEVDDDSASKKAKADDEPVLSINGRDVRCRIHSEVGGYHRLYTIVDDQRIDPSTPNEGWLVRVPIENPQRNVQAGLVRHGRLARSIAVPAIGNHATAAASGAYLVERVPVACDASLWRDPSLTIDNLPAEQRRQLEAIRTFVELNARQGHEVIPDFRPDNIRFRVDGTLVLIDFSEEAERFDDPDAFAQRMDSLVRELAGEFPTDRGNANPHVYEFLTARLGGFRDRMLASRGRPRGYEQ
jgi:hypothetical protein